MPSRRSASARVDQEGRIRRLIVGMGKKRIGDAKLVEETRAGSSDAAETLFSRHWPAAWKVALALTGNVVDAEDVLQEAMSRAFGGIGSFNGRSAFRTWLFRIVVHCAVDEMRRGQRRRDAEAKAGPALEIVRSSPDPDVASAVLQLSPERRTVIVLRYWLGFSTDEIAAIVDLPSGTIHSRLSRALAELRLRLEASHAR
jgi:RNA polymerase sigma-70 factor, ECF subfamily